MLNRHGKREVVTARALVNATGPWLDAVAETVIRQPLAKPVRLIKGSHIVVRKRFEHDCGYIFQAPRGRVVFALPFAEEFTLIGTTDEKFVGDVNAPAADADEILYLCGAVNRYFRDKVTPDELVWSFAGVRALYDDGHGKPEDVTRDYVLALDERAHHGPLLTVYGGKITTHRKLAEAAMGKIAHFFPALPPWTAGSKLPGGEFAPDAFDDVVQEMTARWPFVSMPHARRLVRAYGTRAERFLGEAKAIEDLGERFTGDLTEAEVRYLVAHEWAESAEDVLYRRGKLGLMASAEERERLGAFIAQLTAGRNAR